MPPPLSPPDSWRPTPVPAGRRAARRRAMAVTSRASAGVRSGLVGVGRVSGREGRPNGSGAAGAVYLGIRAFDQGDRVGQAI